MVIANSKQIFTPGSVIPTINILDNTSDTKICEKKTVTIKIEIKIRDNDR